MKPFDIEKAKAGEPVITRDGRDVRIICFNKIGDYPIVALIGYYVGACFKEDIDTFCLNGKRHHSTQEGAADLFMKPVKKEGWINIYPKHTGGSHTGGSIYASKDHAERDANNRCIDTIRIEWEE